MQFQDFSAARLLMQAVDVLRDHSTDLSRFLQLRQFQVRRVRLRVKRQHLILIELIEISRSAHKK